MNIQRGKLLSGYSTDFYDLIIVVAIGTDNKARYSFDKIFVDIEPAPIKIKSFDDVDRWYDNSMMYYCQQ